MARLDWTVQRRDDFYVHNAPKQERARISERTIAGLKLRRAKGQRLARPPLPEETVRTVLSLNQHDGIEARKIARTGGFPLGTVSAILTDRGNRRY